MGNERSLASASLVGTTLFVASVLLMHVIQPELSPRHDAVSYYMNGRLGWILGAGLIALGAGSLSLVTALLRFHGVASDRLGTMALCAWGVCATIGGMFAPDPMGHWEKPPSLSGAAHAYAAMAAFLAFPVAALRLSRVIGNLASDVRLARRLWWLAASGAAALVIFFACLAPVFSNRPPLLLGLAERVLLLLHVMWLLSAATGLRRMADRR